MAIKKSICAVLIVSMLAGCATTTNSKSSSSTKDGTQSSSEYKKDEGKGIENFWGALGIGLLAALIFKSAPKEAYR